MIASDVFASHSRVLFGTIDAAAQMIAKHETSELAEVLVDLGRRHLHYSVTTDHFAAFGEGLIFAFESILGKHFMREVKERWQQVYSVVFPGMAE